MPKKSGRGAIKSRHKSLLLMKMFHVFANGMKVSRWKRIERLREDELRHERELHEARLYFETELKKAKSAQAQESGDLSGAKGAVANLLEAKLPKLVITKFNGTFQDWPRFWAQFTESIDKAAIAGVTKFSYLKELLVPKAGASVKALPFSSEGYMRAISILKDKYGNDSEIVKAYKKEILELPVISGVNVKKKFMSARIA